MRKWLMNLNNKYQRYMYGRYGVDEFGIFLVCAALFFWFFSVCPLFIIFFPIAIALLVWAYIRHTSRKFDKRRRELERYLKLKKKVTDEFSYRKKQFKERKTHRYFRCKKCKTILRVPKKKGKIEILCPKCRNKMKKKT